MNIRVLTAEIYLCKIIYRSEKHVPSFVAEKKKKEIEREREKKSLNVNMPQASLKKLLQMAQQNPIGN